MTELIKRPTCSTCKFFVREATEPDEGACKENSPQLTVVMIPQQNALGHNQPIPMPIAAWPTVKDTLWCGRYGAKWAGKLDS